MKNTTPKLIRLKQVMAMTGQSKTLIYDSMKQGIFPKPVPLGFRSVAWVESEVIEWIESRIQARDSHDRGLLMRSLEV